MCARPGAPLQLGDQGLPVHHRGLGTRGGPGQAVGPSFLELAPPAASVCNGVGAHWPKPCSSSGITHNPPDPCSCLPGMAGGPLVPQQTPRHRAWCQQGVTGVPQGPLPMPRASAPPELGCVRGAGLLLSPNLRFQDFCCELRNVLLFTEYFLYTLMSILNYSLFKNTQYFVFKWKTGFTYSTGWL